MAEEIQIAGTQSTAKTRDPLGVALLTLVTLLCCGCLALAEPADSATTENGRYSMNPV